MVDPFRNPGDQKNVGSYHKHVSKRFSFGVVTVTHEGDATNRNGVK